jgi:predicted nuclease of predicted toxin-antitoxin system
MRILCDECVDHQLIECLREAGHDVTAIFESKSGIPDYLVLALSADENRILVTEDYDFGELLIRWNRRAFGVVIIAPDVVDGATIDVFRALADRLSELGESLTGCLTMIESDRTRQRALPRS